MWAVIRRAHSLLPFLLCVDACGQDSLQRECEWLGAVGFTLELELGSLRGQRYATCTPYLHSIHHDHLNMYLRWRYQNNTQNLYEIPQTCSNPSFPLVVPLVVLHYLGKLHRDTPVHEGVVTPNSSALGS